MVVETPTKRAPSALLRGLFQNPAATIGATLLVLIILVAVLAPYLGTLDPTAIDPASRNALPGSVSTLDNGVGGERSYTHWMGTDSLGRDIYSRVLYGGRVSLIVGLSVATLSLGFGLLIGLVAGYVRWVDAVVMRIMDGLMAIPSILLAIALVSLSSAGLGNVVVAITIPEIPRVVRLVRAIVLSARQEPYVEAAISVGTRTPMILFRHILPNTIAPLIVQGTYVFGSAILLEAILSFLGAGTPPEHPTWGNIIADGRALFRIYPHTLLFPGIFLALTVLGVNLLGDQLRDTLDPRLAKRI
ncbi:MAG: ABC transporter permease [Hyphomicrobiaceae bacterium]|nr:MAG: ABC transporter permease [Hyphomicrobiaceae bacterium]